MLRRTADDRLDGFRAIGWNLDVVEKLILDLQRTRECLREVEQSCPCGARPESFNTHPHVISCPVAKGLGSTTVATNYERAIRGQG